MKNWRSSPAVQRLAERVGHSHARLKVLARSAQRRFGDLPFHHARKPVVFGVLPVLLLAAFIVGVVYVRLLQGPMSVRFLHGVVERSMTAEAGDLKANVDDVQLAFSKNGGLEVRIIGVKLSDANGEAVASAPVAALQLSSDALRSFHFAPERIDLIEPLVSIVYSHETGVSLSLAGDRAASDGTAPDDASFRGLVQAPFPASVVASETSGLTPSLQSDAPEETQKVDAVPAPRDAARPVLPSSLRRMDLARVLAKFSASARKGNGSSSYLRQFGLREATLNVDYAGKLTTWKINEFDLDLDHLKQRSVISGSARIDSARGPWVMTFVTDDSDKTRDVKIKASLRDLVPSALGQGIPEFGWLQTLNLPVSGDASIDLTTSGVLRSATLALELGQGQMLMPGLPAPLTLEAGLMQVNYDAQQRVFKLSPSTLKWDGGQMTVAGDMTGSIGESNHPEWRFALKSLNGSLQTGPEDTALVPIEAWSATGRMVPHSGLLELASFDLKAGGASIVLQGELTTGTGPASAKLAGDISPMPYPLFKVLWPSAVAPGGRKWVSENIVSAEPGSAKLAYASGRYLEGQNVPGGQRLSFALEASALKIALGPNVPPIDVPRALINLENDALEITMPDGSIDTPSGKKVPLKGGRFAIADLSRAIPEGELQIKSQTPLAPVVEVLVKAGLLPKNVGEVPFEAIDGKGDAQAALKFPLISNLSATKVEMAGKIQLTDLKFKQKIKGLDVSGGSITIDATGASVQAKGDLLVNGVPFKIDGQRIAEAEPGKQPPLRISATLDNADRTQLGLDINHLVQGEMPVDISLAQAEDGTPKVEVRCDLTGADVGIRDIAWRKPVGKPAFAQFEVARGKTNTIELQNFKVAGDNVAIEGWLSIDETNDVREFYFPDFSLNVVSRVEVRGKLSPDKVWKITAKGSTFDGRDLFKQLVSINASDANRIRPLRPSAGLDIDAEVGTILGHSDVSLRDVRVQLSDRSDKLTALKVDGTLDGGAPLKVLLKRQPDQGRVVYADSTDAGQAFRLAGFYPNVQGGRVRLEVNLEGKGAATKTGILSVDNFIVLGDPVVSEVFSGAPEAGSNGATPVKKVTREKFEFDNLRMPFSAGHGQFVLEESYLRGPVLGATVRGKIDHTTQRISLGGTYVPLQGINSAFCGIPIVGQIISGTKCEGMLGITYAIQGPLSKPQVMVNPFSMVAPGIFREIFQMTNPDPKVQERAAPNFAEPVEARVRSSASEVSGGSAKPAKKAAPVETIDGWSSQNNLTATP